MPESKHRRRRSAAQRRNQAAALGVTRPEKRKTNYLYLVASALIAILVIGGFALGGLPLGQTSQSGSSDQFVEGVGEPQEEMATRNHVPEGDTVNYSTVPPTSGDHWAEWSQCGFFDYQLADERTTHNLEHGNIVISYNLATPEEVDELRDAFDDIGLARSWGLARAYDQIPQGEVVVAAWGVMDRMQGVDRDRLDSFFKAYSGTLGPERIICGNSGVMDSPPADQQ